MRKEGIVMALRDEEIGGKIKMIRETNCLTQNQLAMKIHVAQQTVSRYENGINAVPMGVLENIATELKIPVVYFLGVSSEEYSDEELLLIEYYRRTDLKIKKCIFELVKLMMLE